MDYSHEILITFGGALFLGIFFIIISNKLKVPPIVLLLLGGVAAGPSGIGIINPQSLGIGLKAIIQLAVAIVLFEGGLTLNIKEYREVSSEIKYSLTIGIIITWLASAAAVKYLFGLPWPFSLLAGSLIIVTGPTVIVPLLKRIMVKKNIHAFLHWEGILIDPIGVFISLLCYEWLIGEAAITLFLLRLFVGISIGISSGLFLTFIIEKRWVSEEILNIFILSSALIIYIIPDLLVPESGLLSVVIAGFVIGYSDTPQIDNIKIYKAQLIELLTGLLFILLASNLDIQAFSEHYDFKMIIAVIIVMIVVRPLNIFASTLRKGKFSLREKLFLCWIAPRGIVAASMASLFALSLSKSQNPEHAANANFLEAFTYSIIIGTVVFQGLTAKIAGKLFGVLEPVPTGWLIISAHNLARIAGKFLQGHGLHVVLIDTNIHSVKVAKRDGLNAIPVSALTIDPSDYYELYEIGNILVITKNENLNELICQRLVKKFNKPKLYRWRHLSGNEEIIKKPDNIKLKGQTIWPSIPVDAITSIDIEEKDIIIKKIPGSKITLKHPENILIYLHKGKALPYAPEIIDDNNSCLIYNPFPIELDFNIKPEWVIFSEAVNMSEALFELLTCAKNDYPNLNIDYLHKQLMSQENEYPSVIGYNVSLPHIYTDGINDSVVFMSKIKFPIKCVYNDQVIFFIFLVLSPKGHPANHIIALSKISKFILNDNNRKSLFEAESRNDLISLFFRENLKNYNKGKEIE